MILELRAGLGWLRRDDPVSRPEREALRIAAGAVVAAWVALAVMTGAGMSMTGGRAMATPAGHAMSGMSGMSGRSGRSGTAGMAGMAAMPQLPGMAGLPGTPAVSSPGGGDGLGAGLEAAAMVAAMVVGMMLPSAFPALAYTGARSLRWRRRRATGEFAAGYIGVWLAAAAVLAGAAATLRGVRGSLFAALLLAAVWQLTPAKRRALRACHRPLPLPPRGTAADRAALRFGVRNACACVGSCWPMMFVASLVSTAALAWMAVLAGVVAAEKFAVRPRRAPRRIGVALAVAATVSLLV